MKIQINLLALVSSYQALAAYSGSFGVTDLDLFGTDGCGGSRQNSLVANTTLYDNVIMDSCEEFCKSQDMQTSKGGKMCCNIHVSDDY
jgi:hypothetical protein|tara:strand:- start:262 stop:525 length:264 start_codon:yes stop_codon:yes gene_type:complete